jgi:hydroxyacylglutathione hydrolase
MRLGPGLHLVGSGDGGFGLTDPFDCHVYLVDGGEEATLVDAGIGTAADAIVQHVLTAGVELDRVRTLLLTHAHPDHAGGAADLQDRVPHLAVAASPTTAGWLRNADEDAVGVAAGKRAEFYPSEFRLTACEVHHELREGDRLAVGAVELSVVETPGHADGHLSFLAELAGGRALFGGDLLFAGGLVSLANRPDCRIPEYAASVAKLADAQVDLFLPGHHGISLRDGQRHVDAAHRVFSAGLVPRSVV